MTDLAQVPEMFRGPGTLALLSIPAHDPSADSPCHVCCGSGYTSACVRHQPGCSLDDYFSCCGGCEPEPCDACRETGVDVLWPDKYCDDPLEWAVTPEDLSYVAPAPRPLAIAGGASRPDDDIPF